MQEIWKPIKGYEDIYEVSNFGRVKNIKRNRIRKQGYDKDGYPKIDLYYNFTKSKHIHRLVAETFISNPNNYQQVNHIDGNKLNNNVNNLEWCNPSYNSQHRIYKLNKNSLNPCKKVKCVELNKIFPSITSASKFICRKQSSLSEVISKPNRKCGGYHWIFIA